MSPANLLLLVIAAAAPPLFAARNFNDNSTPKPPTLWINNAQLGDSAMRVILQDDPEYFGAGFICATDGTEPTCKVYLFAVFFTTVIGLGPVIWSANRDHPVKENATLEFTLGGNLVLRDADGSYVWSSGSSGRSVNGMVITVIGNLVLFDHRNATVWQSFDHASY